MEGFEFLKEFCFKLVDGLGEVGFDVVDVVFEPVQEVRIVGGLFELGDEEVVVILVEEVEDDFDDAMLDELIEVVFYLGKFVCFELEVEEVLFESVNFDEMIVEEGRHVGYEMNENLNPKQFRS